MRCQTVSPEPLPSAYGDRWDNERCGEITSNTSHSVQTEVGQRRGGPKAGVNGLLSLATAPTFAIMALLAGFQDGGMPGMLCSATHSASPLTGMVPMYWLMSAFHSAPWLRLISSWQRSAPQS
jgi:hypothetical protein